MRRFAFLLSGIALGATLTSFAAAQTAATASGAPFPTKAVRLIVPFAAGGSTDIIGRAVGQKLGELWGQPVVVDNRPGGNTVIATELVARAAPDGHTLLVTPAPFTIVPRSASSSTGSLPRCRWSSQGSCGRSR